MSITDEQRAHYIAARKALAEAETSVAAQIQAIESGAGIPALRLAFEAIEEEVGDELVGICIFCDKPLFCEDDFVTGDEIMCAACNDAAWASMSEEDKAARMAEIEAEDAA